MNMEFGANNGLIETIKSERKGKIETSDNRGRLIAKHPSSTPLPQS